MELKKDWEIKKLGDVGTFIRGGNFSKKDFVEKGFPCIHYGQIHMKFGIETLEHISSVPSEMVKPDRCAKKGDLVIAITSEDDAGSCKCTAWMGDYDAYVGGHTAIYRHAMQPKYVSYYFNSPQFQKAKLEFTHGFKVVEINPKDIAKIDIPVPSLEEQKRIVKILDEKFAQLETIKTNAQTNLQNAKDLFQSQLSKAFSNTTWEKKRLETIAKIKSGFAFKGSAFKANLRLGNVKQNYLRIDEKAVFVSELSSSDLSKAKVNIGDLVVTQTGTKGKRDYGFVAIIDRENLLLNQRLAAITTNECLFNRYLLYYSYTESFKDQFFANEGGTVGQGNIGLTDIKEIEIPLPPLPEQKRIVKELDTLSEKVRQLQEIYTKQIANCTELKQSLLQKAFEGELD